MTLPSALPISASQINVELTRLGTDPFDIQGMDERALADVLSGPIDMSDFLGKSSFGFTQTDSRLVPSATTFAAVNFGIPHASRKIALIMFHGDAAVAPGYAPTANIDGVAMNRLIAVTTKAGASNDACGCAIFAGNPPNANGTVNVSWNGNAVSIVVVRMFGYSIVSPIGYGGAGSGNDGNVNVNLGLNNGIICAYAAGAGLATTNWTGVTKRGDESYTPGVNNQRSWAWKYGLAANPSYNIIVSPYVKINGASAFAGSAFAAGP